MSSDSGRKAEAHVAMLLARQGHDIVARNWRTRWCEIDVVSTCKDVVYFTEVKYRSNGAWGAGYDYIMHKKLKQMHFAAQFWFAKNMWQGDGLLQVASVDSEEDVIFIVLDGSQTM